MRLSLEQAEQVRDESRPALRDMVHRYCRGVDFANGGAIQSAFHPHARDDHGAYRGRLGLMRTAPLLTALGSTL